MTLFDMPPEKAKKTTKPVTAGKLASGPLPIYEVQVGLTRYYVRADRDESARSAYRMRYLTNGVAVDDSEIKVRRLLHEDIVELVKLEPRLARRLDRL